MADAVVLSYHDSLLRTSDYELLSPSQWLNDNIIGFTFEYFEREEFKDHSDRVAFVSPGVTQCIKLMAVEDSRLMLDPLDLHKKDFVFFAVNDNISAVTAGGMHWSLIMLSKAERVCHHYDSFASSNLEAAKDLVMKLNPLLDGGWKLVDAKTPQQVNSCDCGVYVISLAEYLCRKFVGLSLDSPIHDIINPKRISKKRQDIKDLIMHLATGNENYRSTSV